MNEEIETIKNRIKLKRKQSYSNTSTPNSNNKIIYFKKLLSRTLITIILVLISVIYINTSDENLLKYKEEVFSKNLSFASFNNWYKKHFGQVIPFELEEKNTALVFSEDLVYTNIEGYNNGYKLSVDSNTIIKNITSGIVVYVGEKDEYGNVVIVQGIDGTDIWYGNITNTNLTLYDYVEEGFILGEANGDYVYMVLSKSGEYLDYEEYIKENKD